MSASAPALIDPSQFPALFAPRAADSHKGSFGSLAVLGGGPGMTGAALLAARAALKLGTGKVLVGLAQQPCPLACDPLQPELMIRPADALLAGELNLTAWTAGCGIGTSPLAAQLLAELFQRRRNAPMVLDADGLNLLAAGRLRPAWGQGTVVLTPHPAEAARLLNRSTHQVQAARPAAARELAQRYGAWVVLKGAGSLVCAPDGVCLRNSTGNPGLASAGTGDVLAGMLGALLAQALPPEQAVAAAVWLHGAAADALVAQGIGPIGLTAGELADAARAIRNGRPPSP
ncbi:NAD(P)H-hydrate dehydratase [Bordetella genomosp. 12]|uniref:ADP-dependent (S)-NAD(P)H-hydrate dehydratase n=1 Tax=Bordetella genomosp. 12 TaxID=463035 RepID=A0A261VTY7_9BORD|nr:NAD(P)H-hydrate dehydratase [Bordetella genomosp. 12]OZI77287.1 NAD(P)H-hydrate dehydratase [Bordetella genomosp. 12]